MGALSSCIAFYTESHPSPSGWALGWTALGAIASFTASLIALVVAGHTWRREARNDEVQQAREVTAWVETTPTSKDPKVGTVHVRARNGSNAVTWIHTVIVKDIAEQRDFVTVIGLVPPYATRDSLALTGAGDEVIKVPTTYIGDRFWIQKMEFRDGAQVSWIRTDSGLHRARKANRAWRLMFAPPKE